MNNVVGSNSITWTLPKLERFKKAHKTAVDASQETFTFEGHEFVPRYAAYLIEYLDGIIAKP